MITPFTIRTDPAALDDLAERLRRWRAPNQLAGSGWERGTELGYLRDLVEHWSGTYDWRAHEARLNRFDQATTEIEGQPCDNTIGMAAAWGERTWRECTRWPSISVVA